MKYTIQMYIEGEHVLIRSGFHQERYEASIIKTRNKIAILAAGMSYLEFEKMIKETLQNLNEMDIRFLGYTDERVATIRRITESDKRNGTDLLWEEVKNDFDFFYPLETAQWNVEYAKTLLALFVQKFCVERLGRKNRNIIFKILFPFVDKVYCEVEFANSNQIMVKEMRRFKRFFRMNGIKMVSITGLHHTSD